MANNFERKCCEITQEMEKGVCKCDYGPIIEPPTDDSGAIVTFDISSSGSLDLDSISEFFESYGFVVLRNACPPDVIDQCEQELMDVAGLANDEDLEAVDWKRLYGSTYNVGKGFVGSQPATGPASIQVRQQPNVLAVYARLFGDARLFPTTDRFGLMRPTDIHPEWQTELGFCHWDQNPFHEPEFCRIQAVLTLSEHTATSGGFHCVPGSHRWFQRYGKDKECPPGSLVAVESTCVVDNHLFRIPVPRGSLIVWDSRTAHGNWPNQRSAEWRKVFYMTYFVCPDDEKERQMYRRHFKTLLRADSKAAEVLTDVGRKVFAQEDY